MISALALDHVALRVLVHEVPQRRPRADIVPRRLERHAAHDVAGLLGDGIVERDRRRLAIGAAENAEIEILGRAFERLAAGLDDLGRMRGEEVEHGPRLEQEDARVPVEAACVEILLGRLDIRLLDEALHLEIDAVAGLGLDIAVACMRAVRLDPEHDEAARFGGLDAALDRAREACLVADHVIGRREQHERVLVLARQRSGPRCRPQAPCCDPPARSRSCLPDAPISSSWSTTRKRWR